MKKAFLFSLGLIVAVASLFVSCREDDDLVCVVSVSANTGGNAYILNYIGAPTSVNALIGDVVRVAAISDEGYFFLAWYVSGSDSPISTDAVIEFIVDRNVELVAKFAEKKVPAAPVAPVVYEVVDLGLSVQWAAHNVGATKPEEYGCYYAWGETAEKQYYGWGSYKWCNGGPYTMTKYCTKSDYGTVDNKTVLEPEDDVAHVKWGGNWRMPTREELYELCSKCDWERTVLNGVNGYKVKSRVNDNYIFLPAAGCCNGATFEYKGENCFYWSNSLYNSRSDYACDLVVVGTNYDGWYYGSDRYNGLPVRPVCK